RLWHRRRPSTLPSSVGDTARAGAADRPPRPQECEVSVLFVDIRGYSTLATDCDAATLFSTVNRYTETVSQIVSRHGGSVLEFHGDGLMALFGAPRPLAGRARATVEAGRAIVAALHSAAPRPCAGLPFSVGIGIATGRDCVGTIRAGERVIWTAIG